MRHDSPLSLFVPVHILDDPLSLPQLRQYLSAKKQIRTFEYPIHWNIYIQNIYIYIYIYTHEKINGSVVWNKHSGEQY